MSVNGHFWPLTETAVNPTLTLVYWVERRSLPGQTYTVKRRVSSGLISACVGKGEEEPIQVAFTGDWYGLFCRVRFVLHPLVLEGPRFGREGGGLERGDATALLFRAHEMYGETLANGWHIICHCSSRECNLPFVV